MSYTQPGRANFLLLCLAASLACLPRVTQCSGGLTPLHAQGSGFLAILDLEGRGISAIEAASLTDRLRTALVRTGAVTVVERGQMERVLSEQDFQLTGCTSDECAVEVGQLLGVTAMVAGSIGKVGSTYSVDIRTIDVQSGQIIHSLWRDYRGEIDGLLGIMPGIAEELVAPMVVTTAPPEAPSPASITIATQPPGATVTLDGQVAGITPLDSVAIESDQLHTMSLSLEGYQPVDTTLFAEAGQPYELDISLRRLTSQLTVLSNPSSAVVFLDNRRFGATPLTLFEVTPDMEHNISLTLAGYQRVDTTFFAQAGEHHQLNLALQPAAVAETTVKPPDTPPPETQQPVPSVKPAKAGGGGALVVLALLAATGYYGYTQGWFGEKPPDEGLKVGNPPSVPSP